ncbi:MAG: hypothetical protein F7C38_03055 [Desulfurococcales archaeon]|nr:hypothetical protein [Desulfurococcales archaeon]
MPGSFMEIEEGLKDMGIKVAVLALDNVTVRDSSQELSQRIQALIEEFKARYNDPSMLTSDPIVRAYRKTLWRLGIDPTKVRPSSEALARRIIRGKPVPRINNIVDPGNAASLYYLVPIGLYDLDKTRLPLRLLRCREACYFKPIGSESKVLGKGTPVIVDASNRVVHVYPHRDAMETRITMETRRVLAVSLGAEGIPDERLVDSLKLFVELARIDNPGLKSSDTELI